MAPAYRSSFVVILAALIAVLLGAVLLRQQLVGFVLTRLLTGQGLQVQSLTVDDVGFDALRLADLRLGPEGRLEIDRLEASYRPAELLGGRLRRLEIAGLRLTLDLTADRDPLEGLAPAQQDAPGEKSDGIEPDALPEVRLTDGLVTLITARGRQRVGVSGTMAADGNGTRAVSLTAVLEGDLAQGRAEVTGDLAAGWDFAGDATLADGALALPAAQLTGIAGTADFDLPGGTLGRLRGRLAAESLVLGLQEKVLPPFRQAELDFDLGPQQASVSGRLESENAAAQASLAAELQNYRDTPAYKVDATATAAHDSDLWAAFDLPRPESGRHALQLHADGTAPALQDWSAEALGPSLLGLFDGSRLSWRGEALTYPDVVAGLDGSIALDGRVAGGMLSLTLAEDAKLTAAAAGPDLARALGLPPALAPLLPGPLGVTLAAGGEHAFALDFGLEGPGPHDLALRLGLAADGLWGGRLEAETASTAVLDEAFALTAFDIADAKLDGRNLKTRTAMLESFTAQGRLSGDPETFAGNLSINLTGLAADAAPLELGELGADLDLHVSRDPEGLEVSTAAPARAKVAQLALPGRFRLQAPLDMVLPDARLLLRPESTDLSPKLTLSLQAELPAASGVVYSGEGDAAKAHKALLEGLGLDLSLAGGDWATADLTAKARLTALRLPDDALAATDLRVTAQGNGALQRVEADYSLGALRHEGTPATFTPLACQGRLTRKGKDLDFTLEGTWAGLPGVLAAVGWHDLQSGTGRLDGSFKPLAFEPGGLQPADFAPAAAVLEKVSGEVEATARLDWNAAGLDSRGLVDLRDIAFTSQGVKLRGLDTAISFSDLLNLRSLPHQLLRVARIDPGIPVTDLSLRYALDPAVPGGLSLGKGEFSVLGAKIGVTGSDTGGIGALQDLTFSVRDLQLEKLFQIIDAEGFSGSGVLAGSIPVTLEAATLVIRDARLAATGPGRLKIESADAKALLQAGGEQAALLLEALEDFHYQKLELSLANTAENDLDLTLSILGNNPAVLDGHPFQLNINLESNISRLLDALLTGYKLSNETLQRLWKLRP